MSELKEFFYFVKQFSILLSCWLIRSIIFPDFHVQRCWKKLNTKNTYKLFVLT